MKKWSWSFLLFFLVGCGSAPTQISTESSTPPPPSDSISSEGDYTKDSTSENEEETISFVAVGDNLIHNQIYDESEQPDGTYDFSPRYEFIAPDIEQADLAYVNQESIIGGDDIPFSSYPTFNTPSDMAQQINDLGFNLVSIANNHTLDKGPKAVVNTLAIWDEYSDNILVTGAFDSQEARDTIPLMEMDGVTFSFLAYTYGTNGIEPDVPYRLNYFDEELVTKDVEKAKEQSDFVIVSAHWGEEYAQEPNDYQKRYAQLLADLEVDEAVSFVIGDFFYNVCFFITCIFFGILNPYDCFHLEW